nr:MAG TPA: hypothetical protein [Caudoviricetes sp.]
MILTITSTEVREAIPGNEFFALDAFIGVAHMISRAEANGGLGAQFARVAMAAEFHPNEPFGNSWKMSKETAGYIRRVVEKVFCEDYQAREGDLTALRNYCIAFEGDPDADNVAAEIYANSTAAIIAAFWIQFDRMSGKVNEYSRESQFAESLIDLVMAVSEESISHHAEGEDYGC